MADRYLDTQFLTFSSYLKTNILQSRRSASLLVDVLLHYHEQKKFELHEFVIMPNHAHILLSPLITMERSVQLIKGGFSYRISREHGFSGSVWQPSYYSRKVRDANEYVAFVSYIHMSPVRKHLVERVEDWEFTSAGKRWILDEAPQRLKPRNLVAQP
jgi:REP-associated tyrosine transposase